MDISNGGGTPTAAAISGQRRSISCTVKDLPEWTTGAASQYPFTGKYVELPASTVALLSLEWYNSVYGNATRPLAP